MIVNVLQRLVAKTARLAGITHRVTPHTLRHTIATCALRQGQIDLATLSRLLGHENLTTTARYLHSDLERVAAMVEDL
jgi:site-specific recombinase XerD